MSRKARKTPRAGTLSRAASARGRRGLFALVLLFVASGATSLVYENLWARQLHLVFGASQVAIYTVLAAFMAGLAIGGLGAARWAARVPRPLVVYAMLEAFIGLYALAFPFLLGFVQPLYLAFFRSMDPSPLAFSTFQLLLVGLTLLPPTVCMGATLPLLARFVGAQGAEIGRWVGRLYGANTIGAVIGTGLAGFVLLPGLGLKTTTLVAALANFLLAAAAWTLARRSSALAAIAPKEEEEERREPIGLAGAALLAVAFLAGFSSLLYEVAWFRLLTLILGGSAYSFSLMLLAFLLGIGLGGWGGGAIADRSLERGGLKHLLLNLALLQVGVGGLSWIAMYLYGELPYAFTVMFDRFQDAPMGFWLGQLGLGLAIMLPPAILIGATFPFLVRALAESSAAAGRSWDLSRPVGLLYGSNTVGAILGASLGGLILLPSLHIQGSVSLGIVVNFAGAALVVVLATRDGDVFDPGRLVRVALLVAGVALPLWATPAWNPLLMNAGMFTYVAGLEDRTRSGLMEFAVDPFELLYYDEGLSSVVTVARERNGPNIWLANNGKVDASSHSDLDTQLLLGHLPFAFRPDAENVLVIGLASGISLGAVTLHPSPKRIDILEIEPAVVDASRFFQEHNNEPLDDPRVRLQLNDARNHLLLTQDGTYDMVSSEPSNPWLSGVSNLFTLEFFQLGKRKMRPGGVWAQWIQTYGMQPEDLRSLLGTIGAVFRHLRLFRVGTGDLIVIASDEPLPLDASTMRRNYGSNPAVLEDLERIGLVEPESILSLYMLGTEQIRVLVGNQGLNTDDNMRIEYAAPLALHVDTSTPNMRMIFGRAETPLASVRGLPGLVALAKSYKARDPGTQRARAALEAALELDPLNAEARGLLSEYDQ